jgi:hypothetical protein
MKPALGPGRFDVGHCAALGTIPMDREVFPRIAKADLIRPRRRRWDCSLPVVVFSSVPSR